MKLLQIIAPGWLFLLIAITQNDQTDPLLPLSPICGQGVTETQRVPIACLTEADSSPLIHPNVFIVALLFSNRAWSGGTSTHSNHVHLRAENRRLRKGRLLPRRWWRLLGLAAATRPLDLSTCLWFRDETGRCVFALASFRSSPPQTSEDYNYEKELIVVHVRRCESLNLFHLGLVTFGLVCK